ncbi:MAG TPA: WbuC family cupin fold metalloprotein [Chloroflexia bacterium]|nr:WbuC family cupin fold metalloprotein [Chloroflexia bacterium]
MTNRIPPPSDSDALALRPIDRILLDMVALQAQRAPRRRALVRYQALPEAVQRMLNALEPGSYVRPHAHLTPPKVEVFLALRGRGLVVRFDPRGAILETAVLTPAGPQHGVEIPPGAWHTALALEPGTVFYEIKEGPYDPATDKTLAPWAPDEADGAAGHTYLADLRRRLHLPPLDPPGPDPATLDEADDDLL